MPAVGALSAGRALHLPVRLHGIQLGRAVDLLLDASEWRAVGFDVLCGDDAARFLPFSTAKVVGEEIVVASALMLLEDVEFYRTRARSTSSLLGVPFEQDGEVVGALRDLELDAAGAVVELVLEHEGAERRIAPGTAAPAATSRRDAA
jgi:hypothetical protein